MLNWTPRCAPLARSRPKVKHKKKVTMKDMVIIDGHKKTHGLIQEINDSQALSKSGGAKELQKYKKISITQWMLDTHTHQGRKKALKSMWLRGAIVGPRNARERGDLMHMNWCLLRAQCVWCFPSLAPFVGRRCNAYGVYLALKIGNTKVYPP